MKIPHKISHPLALITVVLMLSIFAGYLPAQVPCSTPPVVGQSTTWKQGASVNVMIDPTFSGTQHLAIKDQFEKWKNAGGANVTFDFVAPSEAGDGAANGGSPILAVFRQVPTNSPTAQGETRGFSVNGNRGDSTIEVNPGVSDPTAFNHVLSHEIGHTFGLADCEGCPAGSSAMTLPQSLDLNARGGHDGPTPCDNDKVKENGRYTSPLPTPTPVEGGESPCNDGKDNDLNGLTDCEDSGCAHYCIAGCNQAMWDICIQLGAAGCYEGSCYTPILIDIEGDGIALTSASNGVLFSPKPGVSVRLAWIMPNEDDAWLALDRNDNGSIDDGTELFGSTTPQPFSNENNGFRALAEFDNPEDGGNGDELITADDAVYNRLLLWQDRNHNGISEAEELEPLAAFGIRVIELDYKLSKHTDRYGNRFRYRAKVKDSDKARVSRWAWDVFLKML